MVEECRARGLTVDEGDLLSHLRRLPDGSLGGLFAAQVVEHLEPDYLLRVLDAAFHALRPGATLILETINVASWSAFFQSYIRDITHVRPLHPDTLRYLVSASGFQKVEVSFRSPCPEQNRLELVPPLSRDIRGTTAPLANLVVAFNENTEKLNGFALRGPGLRRHCRAALTELSPTTRGGVADSRGCILATGMPSPLHRGTGGGHR